MELRVLRSFLVVAREESISGAANTFSSINILVAVGIPDVMAILNTMMTLVFYIIGIVLVLLGVVFCSGKGRER